MFNEVFGAGLILVGLALQFSVGPIHWSDFAFPINLIFLIVFLLILVLAYWLRRRVRLFSFLLTAEAAVPTLIYAAALTVVMGLTRQVSAHERAIDPIGLTQMLSFWPVCTHLSPPSHYRGADHTAADPTLPSAGAPLTPLPRRAISGHRHGYAR